MDVRSIEDVRAGRRAQRHRARVVAGQPARDVRDHQGRASSSSSASSRSRAAASSIRTQHPTHEFYYVTAGRGLMTIDGRGAGDRAGRPRAHPARRRAQPAAGERSRADPLLLLRGRRRGRGRSQLHRALSPVADGAGTRHPPSARRRPGSARGSRAGRPERRRRAVLARRAGRARRRASTRSSAVLTDQIDADVLAAGRRAGCGSSPTSRSATTTSTSPRRHASTASSCATRPACSTRRPPTSRSVDPRRASRARAEAEADLRAGRWTGWGITQYLGRDVHGADARHRRLRPHRPRGGAARRRLRHAGVAPHAPRHRRAGLRRRSRRAARDVPTSSRCTCPAATRRVI